MQDLIDFRLPEAITVPNFRRLRQADGLDMPPEAPHPTGAGLRPEGMSKVEVVRGSNELPARLQFTSRPIRECSAVEIHLDVAAAEVAADQLLGKRILYVSL